MHGYALAAPGRLPSLGDKKNIPSRPAGRPLSPQDERTRGVNFYDFDFSSCKESSNSYFSANVNVDGKDLKQIKKINIPLHLLIVHCGNSVLTDSR